LILGAMLDHFGFPRSVIGLWPDRTFAGEGESIFDGIYAAGQLQTTGSLAEA
jgi:hypothetical protein